MENAIARCLPRLEMGVLPILITAFFCGILMYTAVAIYKEKGSPLGIFFCVPVFILSGFEYSIADMFYFFCARMFSGEVFLFLLLVVIGNAVGGMFIPALRLLAEEKKQPFSASFSRRASSENRRLTPVWASSKLP